MFLERFKLTAAEKAKPYAKYFYRDPAPFEPEAMAAMARPIDPALALPIERRNDLLNPGYFECEAGWCVMPDGSGYIANLTRWPGATVDMIKWWFAWHALGDDLRYKIWFPKGHFAISVSEADRKRALDPATDLDHKLWGMTHNVTESCDAPTENIYINFLSPEDMGFDMERFHSPNVACVCGGHGTSQMINPPLGAPNFKGSAAMVHSFREVEGGLEQRTRFWMGKKFLKGKAIHTLPGGVKLPPFVPMCLARHNVKEFANLRSFLPEIYAEHGGTF